MKRYLLSAIVVAQIAANGARASSFLDVHGAVYGGCTFSLTAANPVSGSCSGPVGGNGAYAVIGSDLEASATYSSLKAYAFQDIGILSNFYGTETAVASATAFINDYISLPSSYTQAAYVQFGWAADGTGYGDLTLYWGSTCVQHIVSSSATCTSTQKVLPGSKYNLEVVLTADATLRFLGSAGNEVSQTSDFSHTAILTSVGLFDQNMNPLTDVQLVSDSGFNYQSNVTSAAPEPGGLTLMFGGVIACGLILKRRLLENAKVPARSEK